MAAKLPAAAAVETTFRSASGLSRRTVAAATPPPSAMSGASGPITAPRLIDARAATRMPGRLRDAAGPEAAKPPDGSCPALPGR